MSAVCLHMWVDLQKLPQMAPEVKFNLKPIIMYSHTLPKSINYMAIDSQVCFYRQLLADSVKSPWCITSPVGSLGSTNQYWWGTKSLPMVVLIYPVNCVATSLSSTGNIAPLSVPNGSLQLAHPPPSPVPPPTHPLYMKSMILQELYVTGLGKTDHNVTFCISRNTVLKHWSRCGSLVLHYSHERFAV